uniref:Peroxisomal sarcosine oxidase-like n=1 Tax=Saccoglossus kowalevskii TaxID=10224 RepID=A0ABM0MH25_SACKO|nr:PREDICTED: peroxisomal sarcosine oxidase-like [Saccoglossus kowalevskii]
MATPSEPQYFEYIVIGCGGIGSAATYWLAKRAGKDVLGLEQFKLGHDNGGSQDHSRIIRMLYHEECYTKLVRDTYTTFEEVEKESGVQLVYRCGGLEFTRADQPQAFKLDLWADAMAKQNIPFERLSGEQICKRFPQFTTGPNITGLYQKDSGLVDAAMANATHIQLARKHGATIRENCKVLKLEKDKDGYMKVYTNQGLFRCRRVVITSGAWTNHVLGSVGVHIPLTVTQEQVTYFATPNIKEFTKDNFPVWIFHDPGYDFYGLPIHGNTGSKIGIDAGGPSVTPETRTYNPDPIREKLCMEFFGKYIPKALGPKLYTKTCLYAMPPDRNFVIDTLTAKGFPQVIVCNGAGHAFKFSCLLGKILSQMAIDGNSQYPIDVFRLDRPALTDPSFKNDFHFDDIKLNAGKKQAKL